MANDQRVSEWLGASFNSGDASTSGNLESLSARLDAVESQLRWSRKVIYLLLVLLILWTVKEFVLLVASNLS